MFSFLADRLSSIRRIFIVMITFGLMIGLAFPFIVAPFVTFDQDRIILFRVACLLAGLAVGSFCFYLVKITLYQNNRLLARRKAELEDAKERFSSLTRKAIRTRDWSVEFEDERLPTCWQMRDCDLSACPAHGRLHIRCWLLAGTYCDGILQGHFAQKLGDCANCEVYRLAVNEDPIHEIGENFNSLMLAVHDKEKLLASAHIELQDKYTELEVMHRQAEEMANTDHLTGLRNHAYFQNRIREEFAGSADGERHLTLLMLDLDHFKTINDRFGHQKGDEVLSRMGAMLLAHIPRGFAARYGGEEFMAVLPDTAGHEAGELGNKLRLKAKTIAAEADLPPGTISVSIGIAEFPACAAEPDGLISAADTALLFAKRNGRDRVVDFMELAEKDRCICDLEHVHDRLEQASLQALDSLAEAVDLTPKPVADSLTAIIRMMAASLAMEKRQTDVLTLAGRLNDLGKIGIPAATLGKKERLSLQEYSEIRRHPQIARHILEEGRDLQDLISAILYHHERWDGKGYPEGLQGEQIPVMARIVGITDAYRAMICDRPYSKAMRADRVLLELESGAGSQFDPELVKLFVKLVRDESGQAKKVG